MDFPAGGSLMELLNFFSDGVVRIQLDTGRYFSLTPQMINYIHIIEKLGWKII